jgi:hypothetical protein
MYNFSWNSPISAFSKRFFHAVYLFLKRLNERQKPLASYDSGFQGEIFSAAPYLAKARLSFLSVLIFTAMPFA